MTVAEQQMTGAEDKRIFEVCRDEGRVLVTLDHDFGQTLRFPPEVTAGIVVLECKGRVSPSMILARVRELAAMLRALSDSIESESALASLFDRIFCGKPVSTFPENALERDRMTASCGSSSPVVSASMSESRRQASGG